MNSNNGIITKKLETFMTSEKLLEFQKRWRKLESLQRDLDYQKSVFARDLRACFTTDTYFTKWCDTELGMGAVQARELLNRAALVKVVPEAPAWNEFGGFDKMQGILKYPKREQIAIVQAARAESRSIPNVIKLRHPEQSITVTSAAPMKPVERKRMSDAETLAQCIVENAARMNLSGDIVMLVRMYVPSFVTPTKFTPAKQPRR